MDLDKTQHKALEWMTSTTLKPVLTRCIAMLIVADISDVFKGSKCNRQQYLELLHSDDCQKELLLSLAMGHAGKSEDLIREILNQHDIMPDNPDNEIFVEHLSYAFKEEILKFKSLIEAKAYGVIFELSRVPKQGN